MSLDNLVKTGQLKKHVSTPDEVQRLLRAIRRNLDDSRITAVSDEARFDVAYRAIMQCALVGVLSSGYRPSTQMPGHHQMMIQTLSLTMGVPKSVWLVLDALRKKRNLSDDTGEGADSASVRECVVQAESLIAHTVSWLEKSHKQLIVES